MIKTDSKMLKVIFFHELYVSLFSLEVHLQVELYTMLLLVKIHLPKDMAMEWYVIRNFVFPIQQI